MLYMYCYELMLRYPWEIVMFISIDFLYGSNYQWIDYTVPPIPNLADTQNLPYNKLFTFKPKLFSKILISNT